MPQPLSGPGVGLPLPQNLYPSELNPQTVPYDSSNPYFTLEAGEALTLPAGNWYIGLGAYSVLQYLDPITNIWRVFDADRSGMLNVKSDGFTVRIANLTGCPVAAIVTNGGSGYTQSGTSVTPSTGNSTWQPIIGGILSSPTVVTAGSGFTVAPLVFIPAPPSAAVNGVGGVPATAYASLTNGTVSSVTLVNAGAGYLGTSVTAQLLPSPFDPNIGSIANGSASFTVGGAGTIAAVLCTNSGDPVANASINTMTLSVSGAGSSGAVTPVMMQTVVSDSIAAGGAAWGTATEYAGISSTAGAPTASDAIGNPAISLTKFRPRRVYADGVTNAGGTITAVTIHDSGLFAGAATPVITSSGTIPTTAASIAFTMGSTIDTVFLQPAP